MDALGGECLLGPGCVFGELELLQVRAGGVIAGEFGGTCFAVSSVAVLATMKALSRTFGVRNLHFLSTAPLFRFLDAPDLAILSRNAFSLVHSSSACLYHEWQMPKKFLYILKSGGLVSCTATRQNCIFPGECLDHRSALCQRPHAETVRVCAESDAEILALSFQLLQDVLGENAEDFLWRCVLLRMLRDLWSDRPAFCTPLMWRDDPEGLARACVIKSFPAGTSHMFSAEEADSIVWCTTLDGSLPLSEKDPQHSQEIFSGFRLDANAGSWPKDVLLAGSLTSDCTLAVLLQDAVGAVDSAADKLQAGNLWEQTPIQKLTDLETANSRFGN